MSVHKRGEQGLGGLTRAKVLSPVETGRRRARRDRALWLLVVLVVLAALAVGGHVLVDHLQDTGTTVSNLDVPAS
jgi:paraquat-inducible protein B